MKKQRTQPLSASQASSQPPTPATPPEPPKLPEWLRETPVYRYTLYAYPHAAANDDQDIDVTLEEYEFLKRTLAQHRGIIDADGVLI